MICCPMTSRVRGYVFEVVVPGAEPSAVLADQIKSVDWVVRRATQKGVAPPEVLAEVQAKLKALLAF